MKFSDLFLTGMSGWLGQALLPRLLNHSECQDTLFHVFLLPGQKLNLSQKNQKRVRVFYGNLKNPKNCENFFTCTRQSAFIHIAGIIHPKRTQEFYQINQEASGNLLQAAVKKKVKRAIILSSNSPFGFNRDNRSLFDETSSYHPYMNYGRSKMLLEQEVFKIHRETDLETIIIRAPWFYGAHSPPRQSTLFQMVREGRFPILGDGKQRRSMCHVENLCQGILLCLFAETLSSDCYWIADQCPYSVNQIVSTIQTLLKDEFKIKQVADRQIHLPKVTGHIAQTIDFCFQSFGFYSQKFHVLSEMNRSIACSIEKAKKELGYRPEWDLENGMKQSIQWTLDQGIVL